MSARAWPLRVSDLQALSTDDPPLSPLDHHLSHLCPSRNDGVQIGSTRLVFLDSGRDVLPRWRTVHPSRYPLLIRSLRGSWINPACWTNDRVPLSSTSERGDQVP